MGLFGDMVWVFLGTSVSGRFPGGFLPPRKPRKPGNRSPYFVGLFGDTAGSKAHLVRFTGFPGFPGFPYDLVSEGVRERPETETGVSGNRFLT